MENEVVKEVIKEGITVNGKFFDKETVLHDLCLLTGENKILKLAVFGLGIVSVVLVKKLKDKSKVVVINVPKKEEKED